MHDPEGSHYKWSNDKKCATNHMNEYISLTPFSDYIRIEGKGVGMLTKYIERAMRKAKYEILPDDNTFYGYIPGFDCVYANAKDLGTCQSELREVLEEWILLSVSRHLPLPIVDGISLVIEEAV